MNIIKKARPLPTTLIKESLKIDATSPSGLRWLSRSREQFRTKRGWLIFSTRFANLSAGSLAEYGPGRKYWSVCIGGNIYRAHRIIYFLAHGIDPGDLHVDHIDNNTQNNNPLNLRLATHAENTRNSVKQRNNTSGCPGVGWHKQHGKWCARIKVNGKYAHIGLFDNITDAIAARKAKESVIFGEYSYDASQKATKNAA